MFIIDTRNTAKRLQKAGFNEEQVDALTGLLSETVPWEDFVTKEHLASQLQLLKADLKSDISQVRADFAAQSVSQIKYLLGSIALLNGMMLALLRLSL